MFFRNSLRVANPHIRIDCLSGRRHNETHYHLNTLLFLRSTNGMSAQLSEQLYLDHHDWLNAWLCKRLGCSCDAEDLTHDTYLRIVVSGRMPSQSQSRAYLIQVAKGLVIDLRRRRALERAYLDSLAALPEAHAPSTERQALVLETILQIDRALDRLPVRAREAFLLSQFDGLTYGAIAKRLRVSVGSVRKYMLKAAMACLTILEAASVDAALR